MPTGTTPPRKTKRSYTLSPESVAYLEGLRKRRRSASTSAVLDEILLAARRHQERFNIEKSVAAYYSSLSPAELAELGEWGDFALSQFPNEP
jgi:hypothetical protein